MAQQCGCEWQLVQAALHRLAACNGVIACCQVPLLGRCVDLVYVRGATVTTVEFKLTDWRRALKQASDHRLGADYAYVCTPRRRISLEMRTEFGAAGVGLLFLSEHARWPFEAAVDAPRSTDMWRPAREGVLDFVLANSGRSW